MASCLVKMGHNCQALYLKTCSTRTVVYLEKQYEGNLQRFACCWQLCVCTCGPTAVVGELTVVYP